RVELPECCVICAEPGTGTWQEQNRPVERLGWAFWAPLAVLLLGLFLSVVLWTVWLFLLALPAAVIIGYLGRNQTAVQIRWQQCGKHTDPGDAPAVRALGKDLIVEVGHRGVKRRFLRPNQRTGGSPPPRSAPRPPRRSRSAVPPPPPPPPPGPAPAAAPTTPDDAYEVVVDDSVLAATLGEYQALGRSLGMLPVGLLFDKERLGGSFPRTAILRFMQQTRPERLVGKAETYLSMGDVR